MLSQCHKRVILQLSNLWPSDVMCLQGMLLCFIYLGILQYGWLFLWNSDLLAQDPVWVHLLSFLLSFLTTILGFYPAQNRLWGWPQLLRVYLWQRLCYLSSSYIPPVPSSPPSHPFFASSPTSLYLPCSHAPPLPTSFPPLMISLGWRQQPAGLKPEQSNSGDFELKWKMWKP